MTKKDLEKFCKAEFENLDKVLKEIHIIVKGKDSFKTLELAATSTFLHNFYNGIENILKRALIYKRVRIKETATWHKDLLLEAKNKNIISEKLHEELLKYLAFRHFFVHSYGFFIKWPHLKVLVEPINEIYHDFKMTINALLE